MIREWVILGLMFVTLIPQAAQENKALEMIRSEFQEINSEEDIEKILTFQNEGASKNELLMIKAYQAAATCMMANYVFSPMSKLKYFNEGKKNLEELILSKKDVENVYLRLLLQLNVPTILNYDENIEEDVAYLDATLAKSPIDLTYKNAMIKNLVSVAKKKELKDVLLLIDVVEQS